MDRYTARINLHGTTQRERMVNRTKANLQNKVVDSLSYKTIKLNGIETQLVINEGTQPYYKEFESMPGQEINIGDYIEWANSWWLVTTCDYDDELYRNGKLQQCNYLLKWQNELGEIIERQAVVLSASKYNDGLAESNVISLGSDKLSINIPLDAEALKLKKSMAKKFFIDNNKEDPTAYLLANTGNVADTYNGHGITHWIVEECAYTASEDDLKYGVCDYISPTTPPEEDDGGKNLFDVSQYTSLVRYDGVDITSGHLTIEGSLIYNNYDYYNGGSWLTAQAPLELPIGTYTLSGKCKNLTLGKNIFCGVRFADNTSSRARTSVSDYNDGWFVFSYTFSVSNSTPIIGFYLQDDGGKESTNICFTDIQLELGNVATEYEPYKGGNKTTILSNTITGTISGRTDLKLGYQRTYTASLVDEDGNTVEWSDEFSWNIVGDIEVGLTENNGTVTLLVDDEDLVDEMFKLTLCHGDKILDEIVITIVSPF